MAAAGALLRRRRGIDLRGRVVLVTGGSRGLGLALARHFAERGARVALCARNDEQVQLSADELRQGGHTALGVACDVRDPEAVETLVGEVVDHFGRLDVVVANAGIIAVGPLDAMNRDDVTDALDTMFWGVYHTTMAALPHLPEGGRVAVITSIGGKIAVPHLLPYSVAKFAAVGFAEGLRAELSGRRVAVTTVVPGLMRTGSHVNALMRGDHAAEYTWFSAGAVLPGLAVTAEHAARRIVAAVRRGDAEVIIGWPAQLAVRLHGLAPATTVRTLGLVNRLLPDATDGSADDGAELGADTGGGIAALTALGRRAVRRYREDRPGGRG
jgi:NAD(P)-dependent dehydrogenase (short-subunit alcohol dehydrogenase family)